MKSRFILFGLFCCFLRIFDISGSFFSLPISLNMRNSVYNYRDEANELDFKGIVIRWNIKIPGDRQQLILKLSIDPSLGSEYVHDKTIFYILLDNGDGIIRTEKAIKICDFQNLADKLQLSPGSNIQEDVKRLLKIATLIYYTTLIKYVDYFKDDVVFSGCDIKQVIDKELIKTKLDNFVKAENFAPDTVATVNTYAENTIKAYSDGIFEVPLLSNILQELSLGTRLKVSSTLSLQHGAALESSDNEVRYTIDQKKSGHSWWRYAIPAGLTSWWLYNKCAQPVIAK